MKSRAEGSDHESHEHRDWNRNARTDPCQLVEVDRGGALSHGLSAPPEVQVGVGPKCRQNEEIDHNEQKGAFRMVVLIHTRISFRSISLTAMRKGRPPSGHRSRPGL